MCVMATHTITIDRSVDHETLARIQCVLADKYDGLRAHNQTCDTITYAFEDRVRKPTFAELVKAWRDHITPRTTSAVREHIFEHGKKHADSHYPGITCGKVRYLASTDSHDRIIVCVE